MADVFVCDAVRTPIGRFGGALAKVRADDLAASPIKALMARHPKLDWAAVDEVYFGCANQAGEDNRHVARMALLLAGPPGAVRDGEGARSVFALGGYFRHHHRLALHQSPDESAIWRRCDAGDRRECRR